jgi:undecaprenyl-diphosphatase
VSRSGSTTLALLSRGFDMKTALKLSFLASMPVIFIMQIFLGIVKGFYFVPEFLLGAAAAFVVGRFSIKSVLKLAEKTKFSTFCIVLGVLSIIFKLIAV